MSRFKSLIFLVIISFPLFSTAQTEKKEHKKGYLYLSWGYNKDWYSLSDLHFKGGDFDFTAHDVKAEDRPNFDKIFVKNISIPQFIYRVGYIFPKHPDMGIEISFDHAKYIMIHDQVVHVDGTIHDTKIDKDTALTWGFLRFEHTNGANFLMLNFFKRLNIHTSNSGSHQFLGIVKPGAGIVVPQSEVALFGVDQNNNYHIAGYVMGIDGEVRYEYKHKWFLESGFKGVFANYTNVLAVGDSRANHSFFCLEWLIAFGYQFAL